QRFGGEAHVIGDVVIAMAAIDAEEPHRPDAARDLGCVERGRQAGIDFVVGEGDAEPPAILPEADAAAETLRVLIDRVVLEDIDRQRLLAVVARPRQKEERAAVMHADLGHRARDAGETLRLEKEIEQARVEKAGVALDLEEIAPQITVHRNPGSVSGPELFQDELKAALS